MGWLDDLLPIRQIVHAGVEQTFVRDLEFDSTQFALAVDTTARKGKYTLLVSSLGAQYIELAGMAAPAVAPAGRGRIYFDSGQNAFLLSKNAGPYGVIWSGSVAGDVTGLPTATVVEKLTGAAGVVNVVATVLKLDSATGTHAADGLLRTKDYSGSKVLWGGRSTLGGGTDAPIVSTNNYQLIIGSAGANTWELHLRGTGTQGVHLTAGATTTLQAYDSYMATGVPFHIDGVAGGTFHASGFFRTKYYAGAQVLWGGRYASGDADIVKQTAGVITFGHGNWGTVEMTGSVARIGTSTIGVQVAQVSGSISALLQSGTDAFHIGSTGQDYTRFSGTNASTAKMEIDKAVTGYTIGWEQQTGDVATGNLSILGHRASSSATGANEHGGNVLVGGGQEDGAGSRGDVTVQNINIGTPYTQAMADANQTVSAANGLTWLIFTTGALTLARDLTITRRPTAGNAFFLKNDCTGANVNVKFLSGASKAIPPGEFHLVYGDGVDAKSERVQ